MNSWYGEQILSENGKDEIKNYQYKGGDLSYIYKYITGPLAQWVVDTFYPATLA